MNSWSQTIVRQAKSARSTTVGLVGGSRKAVDRRVLDRLAKSLVSGLREAKLDPRVLVVRLEIREVFDLIGPTQVDQHLPDLMESPLGRWSHVDIPMPVGRTAPWTLEQLPKWLPSWKKRFGVIMLDLGPMHLVPSRTIGRLCDSCFVLLGPDSCGSCEWIQQHMSWHQQSGTQLSGCVLTTFESLTKGRRQVN
ncbi:MAG: hypothetical protein R3C53_10400 [Pirellulaceae bacterium]